MKKIILAVAVVATAAIAGWNYQQGTQSSKVITSLTLENMESIAGCEVSASTPANSGGCTTEVGSNREVCARNADGPVCSGTF